jgi:rhamnulokinase
VASSGAVLAVDLGASSGRVILGDVAADRLQLTELNRFRNGPVRLPDGLYWDVLGLYQDVLTGLRAARNRLDVKGVAVDSWAVDYGLLDAEGRLLSNPMHYRDERTAAGVGSVAERVPSAELYGINGLQQISLNTVYQMAADRDRITQARRLLLIPDLIGYWLTGEAITERTNASTTGLLDARTGQWSAELLSRLDLPMDVLTDLVDPGTVVGRLSDVVRADTGLSSSIELTTVGSHDTASAVVGVPAREPGFGFISCGTWGLVGVELEKPVLSVRSAAANFTNERGVDATVRYLRNVMGLWLLQESLREWTLRGLDVDLATVLAEAATLPPGGPTVDAESPTFLAPGNMPDRLAAASRDRGDCVPSTPAQFVRCIIDSLAMSMAKGLRDAQRLSGTEISVAHMVGGGARNALLCQLTADELGLPVIAGPVEATAIGNLLVQARTHGIIDGDLWSMRALVRATQHLITYLPRSASRTSG